MKTSIPKSLQLLFISILFCANVFSSDVTFQATVKTDENEAIPRVYVRIYIPGDRHPTDSMFTDSQGFLERVLHFRNQVSIPGIMARPDIFIRKLSPNVISQKVTEAIIEYDYPGIPELFFVDLIGRTYSNHSELPSGLYFYFLRFDDGYQSELNRMVVTEKGTVNVKLISGALQENGRLKSGSSAMEDPDRFVAVIIKDGYVTEQDTISIDAAVITKIYQLSLASKPTADFSFSGDMIVGKPVVFNAASSYGANGEDLVYSWDFGNGKRGQSSAIPHVYLATGDYLVTLTVTGDYGASHSISKTVAISQDIVPNEFTGIVKGYISDENLVNVSGATVSLIEGDEAGVSDNSGMVTISDLPVGVPVHLKITKTGYVNQVVRITIPADTEEGLFFSTLNKRSATITLPNAEFGGTVNGADGALLTLPFDGLLRPDGSVATGNVSVSVTPIDVANNTSSFPGTFNAFRSDGDEGVLLSLGVSEYYFQQGNQPLQLAPGKTATIYIPIYTSGAQAGDEIPLWSINEDNGSWVEEGIGKVVVSKDSPTGLAMKAKIGHLSWWNCDEFDDPKDRDGICYRLECSSAICVREVVPCWWSGAFRDETKKSANNTDQNEIPPVFQVREFVPASGKTLRFPSSIDVQIQASTFINEGELWLGNYILEANAEIDTIEIELHSIYETGDTLDLPIDSTLERFLNKDEMVFFRINIPDKKLYRISLEQGSTPKLATGVYFAKDATGVIFTGEINGSPQYIFPDIGTMYITVSKTEAEDEGNFRIGVYDLHAIPIAVNDSIVDSLSINKQIQFYSVQPDDNTVMLARYFKQDNSPNGYLKFISPSGKIGTQTALYTSEGYLTSSLSKDSVYYFEFSGESSLHYTLITKEDEKYGISYGDTIIASLEYDKDIDIYNFTGEKDDLVSVMCTKPVYNSMSGVFELWNTDGEMVNSKKIDYYEYTNKDLEIIYQLPSDGVYSIIVHSPGNYNVDYHLSLNKVTYITLDYNYFTTLDVVPDSNYYFTVEVPGTRVTHFTIIADENKNGTFNIWSENSMKLTDNINYSDRFFRSYTNILSEGTCYLKIKNETATKLYINILEARKLVFNEKGYIQFPDTIQQLNRVNAFYLSGSPGDGVHAILKTITGTSFPENLQLHCFPQSSKESYTMDYEKLSSNSLDSTILYESAESLTGTSDAIWAFITSAESTGIYMFSFHHVKPAGEIKVDDDFVQYPDAQTSSLLAAGYAVKNGGKILLANGEYSSSIAVTVESDNVHLTGQEKENVHINHMYDYNYSYGIRFECDGARISNLTISSGVDESVTALLYGNAITFENIDIEPLNGKSIVYGRINGGGGTHMIIRNVTAVNAKECLNIGSENGIIENCNLSTDYTSISCSGKNMIVRNNTIVVNKSYRAIWVESNTGYRIDGNHIEINNNIGPDIGIIKINALGSSTSDDTSYVRNNTIISSGSSTGIYALAGNPPSKIIIENNSYKCTFPTGGQALFMQNGRTDGTSSIIVRNNIFDGLVSKEAVYISGVDELSQNQFFGIYNNNFRIADNAVQDTNNYFVYIRGMELALPTDTASVYIANNIFEGNNISYWVKCHADFSFYGDYNVVYDFRKYKGALGTIIGTTHDIGEDPLFIDDDLHIGPASPAINGGSAPDLFPYMPGFDRSGVIRPQGTGYDIGADEMD